MSTEALKLAQELRDIADRHYLELSVSEQSTCVRAAEALAAPVAGEPVGTSKLLDRAIDLHKKAYMPWPDAEQLALSESGIGDDVIDELIGESGGVEQLLVTHNDLRQFARSILVHGSPLFAAAHAPQPVREPLRPSQRTAGFGASSLTDESPQTDVWHQACAFTERAHGITKEGE